MRVATVAIFALALDPISWTIAADGDASTQTHRVVELDFRSTNASSVEGRIELDVLFTTPGGQTLRVPAFHFSDSAIRGGWACRSD